MAVLARAGALLGDQNRPLPPGHRAATLAKLQLRRLLESQITVCLFCSRGGNTLLPFWTPRPGQACNGVALSPKADHPRLIIRRAMFDAAVFISEHRLRSVCLRSIIQVLRRLHALAA